jgi:hypothetical protein
MQTFVPADRDVEKLLGTYTNKKHFAFPLSVERATFS